MIKVGYWYEVDDSTQMDMHKVKIIPSDRWLENQDPKKDYFEVIDLKTTLFPLKKDKVSVMNGTLEECNSYVEEHYEVKDEFKFLSDTIQTIRHTLLLDTAYLGISADKRCREIAYHIDDAIELLDKLQEYEDKGLGDIEY